jgi:glycosyltransferase involved in cell wall biosynthesis
VSTRVEVLVPTHDHARLLPFAIATAQEQTVRPTRIVVVGDGVGDDTRDSMSDLCRDDPDLCFLDLPKAGRTGETHRHRVLVDSDADVVTYLSDDDLMFPDHIERMLDLLGHCDVALPLSVHLRPDGVVEASPFTLGEEPGRSVALAGTSLFSLSGISHTMAAYRRLPFGWRDTPKGFNADQYMLLQFLHEEWCRFDVCDDPTVVHLADSLRRDMTPGQRFDELREVDGWLRRRGGWADYRRRAQSHLRWLAAHAKFDGDDDARRIELLAHNVVLVARNEGLAAELQALRSTRTVRLRDALVGTRLARAVSARRRRS